MNTDKFYTIRPFKHRVGTAPKTPAVVVRPVSDGSGYKTRAARLCDCLKGRWSHAQGGYVMSACKAKRFEELWKAGRDGSPISYRVDDESEKISYGAIKELKAAGLPIPDYAEIA